MLNIDELKAKIEQLDADRLRIFTEINKRRRDLKRFAGQITEEIANTERKAIEELQDVLDDIEFDLNGYLSQLFDFASDGSFEDRDEVFVERLTECPAPEGTREALIQRRNQTAHDLERYKKEAEKTEHQLQELQDLIDATENELDELIVELADLPD